MRFRKAAAAAVAVACAFTALGGTATAGERPTTTSPEIRNMSATLADHADVHFVEMMIPHHFQAIVMSEMAPGRAAHPDVMKLASRIEVEQDIEIGTMRGWQGWNGLPVTDPQQAYEALLDDPMHLEHMGMATPEQLDALSAAQGTTFDVMFLQLMIRHHEGAVDMAIDVLVNGSDPFIQQMATDMLTTQYTQIVQMQALLAGLT